MVAGLGSEIYAVDIDSCRQGNSSRNTQDCHQVGRLLASAVCLSVDLLALWNDFSKTPLPLNIVVSRPQSDDMLSVCDSRGLMKAVAGYMHMVLLAQKDAVVKTLVSCSKAATTSAATNIGCVGAERGRGCNET